MEITIELPVEKLEDAVTKEIQQLVIEIVEEHQFDSSLFKINVIN